MTLTPTEALLVALVVIYAVPFLLWRIARLDLIVPLAIVQIVGGVLLGPGILGRVWPVYHSALLTDQTITQLSGIATWGVCLFLFVAGIELDLHTAWRDRFEVGTTALLALSVPVLLGAAAGTLMLTWSSEWIGAAGSDWQFVVGIGMACAVTALPVLVVLLEHLGALRTEFGQRMLRYASLDDILLWLALAAILLDTDRLLRQAIFLVGFVGVATVLRRLLPRLGPSDRWYVALCWLGLAAFVSDWAGLHYMVGAFLAGVVIDAESLGTGAVDQFRDHVLLLVMPVFFLFTGLRTEWEAGGWLVLAAVALLTVVQLAGKLIGVGLAARLLGWRRGDAWVIGWMLQTKGLIALIFGAILLERHVISGSTFAALLLMAVVSTMLTIPMVRARVASIRS